MKSVFPHVTGSNHPKQWGPKINPAMVATVASPINNFSFTKSDTSEKIVQKIPTQAYAMWGVSNCRVSNHN